MDDITFEKSPAEDSVLLSSSLRKSFVTKSPSKIHPILQKKSTFAEEVSHYHKSFNFSEKKLLLSFSQNIFSFYENSNCLTLRQCGIFELDVFFSESDRSLGISFSNGEIHIFSLQDSKALQVKVLDNQNFFIQRLCFHPMRRLILVSISDHSLRVVNIDNEVPLKIINHKCETITGLDFHPTKNEIILFSGDSAKTCIICIWNYERDENIKEIKHSLSRVINAFFGKDGDMIFTISDDKTLRAWFVNNLTFAVKEITEIGEIEGDILKSEIDQERKKILVLCSTQNFYLYNIEEKGKECLIASCSFENSTKFLGFYFKENILLLKTSNSIVFKNISENKLILEFNFNEKDIKEEKINVQYGFYDGKSFYYLDKNLNLIEFKNSIDASSNQIHNFQLSLPELDLNKCKSESKEIFGRLKNPLSGQIQNYLKKSEHLMKININSRENLLIFNTWQAIEIWDLTNKKLKCKINPEEISKHPITGCRFFLRDTCLLLHGYRGLFFVSLEDLQVKKEMILQHESFSQVFCEPDSELVYFIMEHRVQQWKVDFSNGVKKESPKASQILFAFDDTIKEICFLSRKELCFVLFNRYHLDKIFVYHLNSRKLMSVLEEHNTNILSFRPVRKNDEFLFSCCREFCIFWKTKNLTVTKKLKFPSPELALSKCIEVDRGLTKLYLGLKNGWIYIFDLEIGCEEKRLDTGHLKPITSLILYGENMLASSSQDEQIKLWNLVDGPNIEFDELYFDETSILSAFFSPDGEKLGIIDSRGLAVYVVNIKTKKVIFSRELPRNHWIHAFSWDSKSENIAYGSRNFLTIHNLESADRKPFEVKTGLKILLLVINSKDNQICLSGESSTLLILDIDLENHFVRNKKEIPCKEGIISAMTYHPVQTSWLCVAYFLSIKILNLLDSSEIVRFPHSSSLIRSVCFNSSGTKLCSSGVEAYIRIWDVKNGEEEFNLKADSTFIARSVFNTNDSKIFCCGQNTRLMIFDLRSRTIELQDRDQGTAYNNLSVNKKHNLVCSASYTLNFRTLFENEDNLLQFQTLKILNGDKENFDELCQKINRKMIQKLALNYIKPYNFSIFHVLLYLEEYEAFENFIKVLFKHEENFSFFSDFQGKNVIDNLVEKNLFGLLKIFCSYFCNFPPFVEDCPDSFNESLILTMEHKNSLMDEILNSRIREIKLNYTLFSEYFPNKVYATIDPVSPSYSELSRLFPR